MFKISSAQISFIDQQARLAFEARMVQHCQDFQPNLCKTLSPDQIAGFVRDGLDLAERAGFTNRGPARLYLELMLLFGSAFAEDPQYPWAQELLQSGVDQSIRARSLWDRVVTYQDRVGGPDNRQTIAALRHLRARAAQPPQWSAEDLQRDLLTEIEMLFPEKAAFIGPPALQALIDAGIATAHRHELRLPGQIALIVALMFAFGHGCCADPLFPWISSTLTKPEDADPMVRAERLERKAVIWLDAVLAREEMDV